MQDFQDNSEPLFRSTVTNKQRPAFGTMYSPIGKNPRNYNLTAYQKKNNLFSSSRPSRSMRPQSYVNSDAEVTNTLFSRKPLVQNSDRLTVDQRIKQKQFRTKNSLSLSLDKGKNGRFQARSQSLTMKDDLNVHNVDEINLIPDLPERLDELEEFLKEDELEKVF